MKKRRNEEVEKWRSEEGKRSGKAKEQRRKEVRKKTSVKQEDGKTAPMARVDV